MVESKPTFGRNWHALQEIALYDLIVKNKPVGGTHDGKMSKKVEVVWSPIVKALQEAMPALLPEVHAAVKASKSRTKIREHFDEECCRQKWKRWLTQYKEIKDENGISDFIGRGETGKAGTDNSKRDDSEKIAAGVVTWHLFARFHVDFGSKARFTTQGVVDNLSTPGKPSAIDRPEIQNPKLTKTRVSEDVISVDEEDAETTPARKVLPKRKFSARQMELVADIAKSKMSNDNEMEDYKEVARLDREAITAYGRERDIAKALEAQRERDFLYKRERLQRLERLRNQLLEEGHCMLDACDMARKIEKKYHEDAAP